MEEIYEADDDFWTAEDGGEALPWDLPDEEIETEELEEDYQPTYFEEDYEVDEDVYAEAEQNFEEAYAAYLDARRQMANLKASRGYYPVVALTDATALLTAASTPPTSQLPKGSGKGKNKGKGKGKPKGKSGSAWQSKGGQIQARGQATKCLRCG